MIWLGRVFVGIAALAVLYVGSTWFVFGSPHPCSILIRTYEWKLAAYSDEEWLKLERGAAIIALNYRNFDSAENIRLSAEIPTAPADVVRKYLPVEYRRENVVRTITEKVRAYTPAQCAKQLTYANVRFGKKN